MGAVFCSYLLVISAVAACVVALKSVEFTVATIVDPVEVHVYPPIVATLEAPETATPDALVSVTV